MPKKIITVFAFIFCLGVSAQSLYYNRENLRSDTFNILKYNISLEIGSTLNNQIAGNTQIRFAPKLNNRTFVRFDLLKLVIDSIKEGNAPLSWNYNDTVVRVNFAAAKNVTDTSVITVYYKGTPQIDATGWGGFYFNNTQGAEYAFNLGVGFGANPHNYGRVWFPCFDNFVERAKFEFNITCDSARRSFCNGNLVSDLVSGLKRTRKWVLDKEIPSYLASVTLAQYSQVNWTVNTLTGVKPIVLAAHPSDTTAAKAGFVHLQNCIAGFENYYGPYRWNRFGYCFVPFNSGAMEHATNISYPRFAAGVVGYESDLMAHELSHHWWGDLITCETPEDMWINEGMAVFSSYMFLEWQYGKATYLAKVKSVHDDLLHFLHKKEGGFRAISGVPHDLTYSNHVYNKGGDVAHTLRGYMGDSAFFAALKYALSQNQFKSANSIQLRNLLQNGSGQTLVSFFNNWVLSGGWPHFSLDSVRTTQQGQNYLVSISISQKLFGAPSTYSGVPLEISCFKPDWSYVVKTVTLSGIQGNFSHTVNFNPLYVALNYDSKISDATSHEYKIIRTTGVYSYSLTKAFVTVDDKGADSTLLRVIHHYVKPDPFKQNPAHHRLSDQRYWTVEGIFSAGLQGKIRFNYDGTKVTSGSNAYLDTLLTIVNGDSLALFYRRGPQEDWQWQRGASKVIYTSKTGYIETEDLKAGEYTFGNLGDTTLLGIKKRESENEKVRIFPQPASQYLRIEIVDPAIASATLSVFDLQGKLVAKFGLSQKTNTLSLRDLAEGTYLAQISSGSRRIWDGKLVVE
jgi:hypothetical protein